jgi:hypothetical protein
MESWVGTKKMREGMGQRYSTTTATLHTYSVVVEYRCPIPSLIFFVSTQLSILIQLSSNIVAPSLPSSLNKYGELGRDEKDEGRDGVTIFDDH